MVHTRPNGLKVNSRPRGAGRESKYRRCPNHETLPHVCFHYVPNGVGSLAYAVIHLEIQNSVTYDKTCSQLRMDL